jgi:SAM-dependent methyltransferase
VLLNRLQDDLPVRFSHQEVNQALSRAATGLVLSEVEGASYAAMEYMLAGLPVVSTPSQGGRDIYFDPDYCAVVAPDPRSIRDAVTALRQRNIPRAYVRERTLQRIEPGRRRFVALVEEIIADLGAPKRFAPSAWPFGEISGVPWDSFAAQVAAFEVERTAELAREVGLEPGGLDGVQLEVAELRPIIQAIRAKPGGGVLVFGCGNDSPVWESLNAGGVTAFVEDDAEWAAVARARLRSAAVFVTRYGTTRRQWRTMLTQPSVLAMTLPDEIRSRQWDVILVDGPAGYDDDRPGRMKSIYEASRLVAPGGKVFLHDSERPVESAYAARYLRGGRLFLEAKGRAVLRGYEF